MIGLGGHTEEETKNDYERPLEQMSTMIALNNLGNEPIALERVSTNMSGQTSNSSMISDTGTMIKKLDSYHS